MARTKVIVDKAKLQQAINLVEKAATFTSRKLMFEAVCNTEWAKSHEVVLSPSIIAARFKEFGLTCKTVPSKPGRPKGSKTAVSPVPVPAGTKDGDIETIADAGDETDID